MAFHELLRVRSVKHVEQKAFSGGGSHRGFPGCVDCSGPNLARSAFGGGGPAREERGRSRLERSPGPAGALDAGAGTATSADLQESCAIA